MADMQKPEQFRLEELRDDNRELSEKEMKQVIGGAGAMNRTGTTKSKTIGGQIIGNRP